MSVCFLLSIFCAPVRFAEENTQSTSINVNKLILQMPTSLNLDPNKQNIDLLLRALVGYLVQCAHAARAVAGFLPASDSDTVLRLAEPSSPSLL